MADRSRAPGRPVSRAVCLVLAASALVAACGADVDVITISASPTPSPVPRDTSPAGDGTSDGTTDGTTPDTTPDTTTPPDTEVTLPPIIEPELATSIPLADVIDVDANKPVRAHDEFVAVAFTDIERWWADVYPQVYGGTFEPLEGGIYAGYPERRTEIPGCGSPVPTAYPDLQQYVAFYCEFGDFMAYDDGDGPDSLLTPLSDEFGAAVMGVVLAHEYGHAIQQRTGALDRFLSTIYTEQQSDCFAGAWTGQAYRGESPLLRLGDRDVRTGLIAMLSVRDPVGTNQFVPGGHGSAFDRVGAFQEGFLNGPARCAELLDEPLDLMPNEFVSQEDFFRDGNASYDCSDDPRDTCVPAYVFLADDLNEFWSLAVPTFTPLTPNPVPDLGVVSCPDPRPVVDLAVVCPSAGQVYYSEPEILDLYEEFGDFTLGYVYGVAWAEASQDAVGSPLAGEDRSLLDDCLVGAWVEDITTGRFRSQQRASTVGSSPGDLDEAIRMAIVVGDAGANVDEVGSPFEKIESFRAGVLGGLAACDARLPG